MSLDSLRENLEENLKQKTDCFIWKNYLDEAAKTKNEIVKLFDDDSVHWEPCKSSKTITTYRCVAADKRRRGHVFKTEAILTADLETIVCLLDPAAPYRVQWDSNLIETRVIKELAPNFVLVRHTLGAQFLGLIAARDFVYFCYSEKVSSDITNIFFASVESSECPEQDKTIRAHFYPCVFSMERTNVPGITKVRSILQVEMNLPKILPMYLIEATIPREIHSFYQKLTEAVIKISIDKDKYVRNV